MPTLADYLTLAAILFCIGLAGALTRRNAIIVLVGIEMMLNAANINLVAFWHFLPPATGTGQIFALFAIAIAGAEAAVGLALVIAVYRHFRSVSVEDIAGLKG
ncbi:MAG: NADH-quinone oxidoreductase subunit NuoK [Verrucomicrobia bacterium]|nr:NADH-quinone oxidoreductase subunit NuoK [Verrucomicrobiota bacterium]